MKKICLTLVVLLCFGPVMFAQSKDAKKTPKASLSVSLDPEQKAKDEKQIALKKEELARQKGTVTTSTPATEVAKPLNTTPAKKD